MPRRISAAMSGAQAVPGAASVARSASAGPRWGGPPCSARSQKLSHIVRQSGRPSGRHTNGAAVIGAASSAIVRPAQRTLLIEFFAVSWCVLRTFDTEVNTTVSPPTGPVLLAVRSLDARAVVRLALRLAGFFFIAISSRAMPIEWVSRVPLPDTGRRRSCQRAGIAFVCVARPEVCAMRILTTVAVAVLLAGCATAPPPSPGMQSFTGEVWTWDTSDSTVTMALVNGQRVRIKTRPEELRTLQLHQVTRVMGTVGPPKDLLVVLGPAGPVTAVPKGQPEVMELRGTVASVDSGGRLVISSDR